MKPILLAALVLFCCPLSAARATEAPLAGWEAQLDTLRRAHHLPGLAAAVVQDGKLAWSHGYGFADPDREVPITPDTPFWIASVTKTFMGLLFLKLEREGVIDLDERIAQSPDFPDFCDWLSTSGIVFGKDLRCDAPITIRTILNHTSNGTPGTRFMYNPMLYSRLSRFIEYKHGRSTDEVEGRHNTMAQLMESHVLAPAGLTRTMASQWQRDKALVYFDMAQGFGADSLGNFTRRIAPKRHLAGGAGIVSTVLDLAKYDMALDSGKLGDGALMKKLFTPARTPEGTELPYAFGWYVQTWRGERLVWHSGWDEDAGFSALLLKVPDRHVTLILLANGEGLRWNNPLDAATVQNSPFAAAFLERFVFGAGAGAPRGEVPGKE